MDQDGPAARVVREEHVVGIAPAVSERSIVWSRLRVVSPIEVEVEAAAWDVEVCKRVPEVTGGRVDRQTHAGPADLHAAVRAHDLAWQRPVVQDRPIVPLGDAAA